MQLNLHFNGEFVHNHRDEKPIKWYVTKDCIYIVANIFRSTFELSHQTRALLDKLTVDVAPKHRPKIKIICDHPDLVQRNYPLLDFVKVGINDIDIKYLISDEGQKIVIVPK